MIGNITFTDPANANDLLLQVHGSDFTLTLNVNSGSPLINVTQPGRTLIINPRVAGNDGLAKTGPGNLTLANANLFSGPTTIQQGRLTLTHSLALQNSVLDTTGSITGNASNGVITTANTLTIGGLSGDKDLATLFTTPTGGYESVTDLRLSPGTGVSVTFSGVLTDGADGMTFAKTGAGTQILTGTNTFTGGSTISGGTLQVGGGGTSGTLGVGPINNDATLVFNRSDTIEISQVMGGSGILQQSGSGLLVLSGANTHTGNTVVDSGTLLVNSQVTMHALSVVAVNGGILGGTGNIGGSVTAAAAGNLAPGTSALTGTLSIGGNLDVSALAGGSGQLLFKLSAPATGDLIAVTGTMAIGTGVLGLSDFVLTNPGGLQPGTYTLITTGGITGTLDSSDLSGIFGLGTGTLSMNGNDLEFHLTDIDTDYDGIPDSYELAHTNPPSATSLNPGDDDDSDGLTSLQEYRLGTAASLKDTDGDGFDDFFEINNGYDPTLDTSTPIRVTTIRKATEFRFNAANGASYRIETSFDLNTWNTVETDIIGEGGVVTRFFPTENQPTTYYRVRSN
jgi:fibronectin-binding autotransporter adhesin